MGYLILEVYSRSPSILIVKVAVLTFFANVVHPLLCFLKMKRKSSKGFTKLKLTKSPHDDLKKPQLIYV